MILSLMICGTLISVRQEAFSFSLVMIGKVGLSTKRIAFQVLSIAKFKAVQMIARMHQCLIDSYLL